MGAPFLATTPRQGGPIMLVTIEVLTAYDSSSKGSRLSWKPKKGKFASQKPVLTVKHFLEGRDGLTRERERREAEGEFGAGS
jgi:hypothetical protein